MKEDLLQVVSVLIADPGWIRGSPMQRVTFGTHYGGLSKRPEEESKYGKWKMSDLCKGELVFVTNEGKEYHEIFSERMGKPNFILDHSQIPFALRCLKCGVNIPMGKNWKEAVLEWMQISLAAVVMAATDIDPCPSILSIFVTTKDMNVCRAELFANIDYADRVKVTKAIYGYNKTPWPTFTRWEGLVVGRVAKLDKINLMLLAVDAGLLLTEMERRFQNAIKYSAQLANSASELFHPDSRRKVS